MKCAVLCSILLSLLHASWGNEVCSILRPDFKAPGRRISEEKCREYNWERKCSSISSLTYLCKSTFVRDAEKNEYYYMGAIGYRWRWQKVGFLCNAFLVSPKFAVTTANCASCENNKIPEFVRFGHKNLSNMPVTDVKIVRTILHPEFVHPNASFDIALLELERALPVSQDIAPACLWAQPEATLYQDILLPAFAKTDRKNTNNVLTTMTVHVIDTKTCKPLIDIKLEDHHLCVNESDTENYFFSGASGAPLVKSVPLDNGDQLPYVKAIATHGSILNRIGIYIQISNFVDWIEHTVWSSP